jgi:hypothetical protein
MQQAMSVRTRFECANQILRVADMARSISIGAGLTCSVRQSDRVSDRLVTLAH